MHNTQENSREGTQLHPSTENWIKDLLRMTPPIKTRPSIPLSLSHQEVFISLLSFSIRGQTEWKSKHRKLTKLITWTTALSNSMKLWAMPCRANQDRRVMVQMTRHFQWTKCGPLEKGMAKHFSIPALSTPWIVWKGKKIGHWKMNSQVDRCPSCYLISVEK